MSQPSPHQAPGFQKTERVCPSLHDNFNPRRCHCVPWHGARCPMEAASSSGAGERRSPRWLRPPGVQKRAKAAVTELPRSLRAASKSAERSAAAARHSGRPELPALGAAASSSSLLSLLRQARSASPVLHPSIFLLSHVFLLRPLVPLPLPSASFLIMCVCIFSLLFSSSPDPLFFLLLFVLLPPLHSLLRCCY